MANIDVTDRVLADERLKATKQEAETLALVAKYTDNAVIITDAKSRIEWVNEGFTRMSGYELFEVKGRKPGDFSAGTKNRSGSD